MLNRKFREDSIETYKQAERAYETAKIDVIKASEELFGERKRLKSIIGFNWDAINQLKNKTVEMELEVDKIEIEYRRFDTFLLEVQTEIAATQKMVSTAETIAMSAATISMTPSTAAAIATTFRTVSTGAAISGSLAANASMAWLGGSVLATGGGLAVGSGLMGLAGPVGWGILIAASVFQNGKNKKLGREALEKATVLKKERVSLKGNEKEVSELSKLTVQNRVGLNRLLNEIEPKLDAYGWDMRRIDQDQDLLERLGVLINTLGSASKLLNKKVGGAV
ncbi:MULTISPECIES: hypothetical protein [Exiguobacterium]|uniref:hypothetical protein n=1 Tax=Exiguobacterium TaxID=33986 RepID=UPI001BE7C400|nr:MULTISPECIES: hypothetical protein [Exiguobacterium]MCT4777873.1 hypothetical protein [Exiguobacterium aquaticum]MCT4789634.1 hypothetical protein [Exiguobacterium mexicanum]